MLKLFRYLKPFTLSVVCILLLLFVQALAELFLPTLMADIVDMGIVKGDTNYILRIGGFMLLVAAGSGLSSILASLLSAKTSMGLGMILRRKVFSRIESYSLNEFDKIGTASLITRTTNDITQVQMVLIMMMRFMVFSPMMCIGGIIMAVSKDRTLSLLLVVVLPLLAAIIYFVITKTIPLFKAIQKKVDKLNLVLRENLTGVRVIRAFNRIESEKKRFIEANSDLTSTSIRVNKIMAVLMPLMMLIMNLTSAGIIWFGGLRIGSGHMQVGDMMAFLQYAMQIMFSLLMLSMMFTMIPRAQASAVRINEVLDLKPEILDPVNPKQEFAKGGVLEFKNVTFSYPGAGQPAVSNISFHVEPGETTAIIGGTGSGKTTLLNLAARFYDVDKGSILVDGVDIREMSQESLRAKLGFVPQNAVLFSGGINYNIKYGKENASDEEILDAAKTSQALEFINSMQDGFESSISQGGTNISGGQKQRLSIARALVRKPEIYLFDDSFSALDFKTDARLRAALKEYTADSTIIIVAQRVSTVLNADKIIVLDDGEIAGIGRHKELLRNCELYKEIVASQLSEEELA